MSRPNPNNVPAGDLFNFLVRDFEVAWDLMCDDRREESRDVAGNFMFARQAMAVLELACRVAVQSGRLDDFSGRLREMDKRYFTLMPDGQRRSANAEKEFKLPYVESVGPSHKQLIAVLFDLIRNGQAHQAQQIMVTLDDGRTFGISLNGATVGRRLSRLNSAEGRPTDHLSFGQKPRTGNVWLNVCPGTLFIDLCAAARRASMFSGGIDPKYLDRSWKGSADDWAEALRLGGHLHVD